MYIKKLVKLLNLTLSYNDAESLSAIRKANSIIKDNNISWNEIILSDEDKTAIKDIVNILNKKIEDNITLNMILKKEHAHSLMLMREINRYKTIIKYLFIFLFILVVFIIIK